MHLNSRVKAYILHKINYASNIGAQEYITCIAEQGVQI